MAELIFEVIMLTISFLCARYVYRGIKSRVEAAKAATHRNPNEVYSMIARDFGKMGWSSWRASIHYAPGQENRMRRAACSRTMRVLSVNPYSGTVEVMGESGRAYRVNNSGCTCMDFRTRGLPCVHMYFAAMECANDVADQRG